MSCPLRRLAVVLGAACLFAGACRKAPPVAAQGSVVRLEYSLTVDGKVDDTSVGSDPVELTVGSGVLPRAAEEALVGMKTGDEKWVKLSAEQAYGERDPKAVMDVPRASFGALAGGLAKGRVVLGVRDGKPARALVARVSGATVRLDFNHRLAGKPVSFRLKVLAIP